MTISKEYIAGFFDGEGTICITKSRNYRKLTSSCYRLAVEICQKDTTFLKYLQSIYGGKVYKKLNKGSIFHQYRVHKREDVRFFLEDISPFLIFKKEQAKLAINFLETIRDDDGKRIPMSDQHYKLRENLREQMKLLNHTYSLEL